METVQAEHPVPPKRASPPPPRIEALAAKRKRPQRPRRRRIRSELDRLLSDEGTRNMLKGLNGKGLKKEKKPVFIRGRVVGDGKVGRGAAASTRVFRKPIVEEVVARRGGESNGRGGGRGGGGAAGGGGRGRSVSPGKAREFGKIDCKFVCVSRRGAVGWVTVVQNPSGDNGGGEISGGGGGGGGDLDKEHDKVTTLDGGWGVKVLQSIDSAIRTLEQDSLVSVIVLQNSHSRYFCNGIDLSELVGSKTRSSSRISAIVKAMKSLISTLNSSSKLLVASVTGDCVGFGVMVMPLFDLVYANDKSTFKVHYNSLGQSPEGIALFGNHLCGKLTSLLYLNTPLTATEAHQCGLVHEILWPARYQETLASRLNTLSSQGPLVCASKSIVRTCRKPIKTPDLNQEFNLIEEQWASSQFQDRIRNVLLNGDFDDCFWGKIGASQQLQQAANNKISLNGGGGE